MHEVDSEPLIVLETHDEKVSTGDGIVYGESSLVADGISVWRQLGTFEEDSANLGVSSNSGFGLAYDARCALGNINFLTLGNGFKSINIFTADDNVSTALVVNSTLVSDEVVHRFEGLTVGGHNKDHFLFGVSTCDSGELSQSGHEHWLFGVGSGEFLIPHHESAVTGDSANTLCFEKINCLEELFLDIIS